MKVTDRIKLLGELGFQKCLCFIGLGSIDENLLYGGTPPHGKLPAAHDGKEFHTRCPAAFAGLFDESQRDFVYFRQSFGCLHDGKGSVYQTGMVGGYFPTAFVFGHKEVSGRWCSSLKA